MLSLPTTRLVLTFVVLFRGVLLNVLDQRPSMVESRSMVVGITLALLFSALPFAYRMRRVGSATPQLGDDFRSYFKKLGARPEQIMFFVPIALLTTLIIASERSGMIYTLAWSEGLAVFVFALWVNERSFRLAGLGLLMACAAKNLFIDLFRMERRDQILTALGVGVIFDLGRIHVQQVPRAHWPIAMKRWLPFIMIACAAIGVLVYNERHKPHTDANPRSILYTVADTGRETHPRARAAHPDER